MCCNSENVRLVQEVREALVLPDRRVRLELRARLAQPERLGRKVQLAQPAWRALPGQLALQVLQDRRESQGLLLPSPDRKVRRVLPDRLVRRALPGPPALRALPEPLGPLALECPPAVQPVKS